MPAAAHPTQLQSPRLPITRAPKRARSGGHPYTPGMFDALIDRPVLVGNHDPAQVCGVSVELPTWGCGGVVIGEILRSGPGTRHLEALDDSYSMFMRLPDGREVWVEVRLVEPVPAEDVEPWLTEQPAESLPSLLKPAPSTLPGFSCPNFSPQ